MAYENVRPFRLDTSGFDNALSGLFGALKKRKEDAAYGGLVDSLTGPSAPVPVNALEPQPQQTANAMAPIHQAGYGRESGPGMGNALNSSLINSIKKFEGYTPKAQWDYKQHSIGYGTRASHPGEVIDQAEAERRLTTEVGKARNIVERFAPNAPDGVKDALTSLTYNAGDEWTRSGLGAAVKAGDWDGARQRFVQYNRAGGQVNRGLVNRRNAEAQWFNGQPQQAEPPRVADAAGGNDQTRVLAWAKANPGHPMAQKIIASAVEQRMDPMAGLNVQAKQLQVQGALTEQQRSSIEFYGKQALAVAQLPEGSPQRAAAWGQLLQRHAAEHPEDEITPEEADPITGPQLMAVQAGQVVGAKPRGRPSLEEVAGERQALADKLGLTGDVRTHYIATGNVPRDTQAKEMKEYQTKDAMWADRMMRAERSIDEVAGIDEAGKPLPNAYNPAQDKNRFWPDDMYGANLFNSRQWQQYQQAARESIAAILRKDTGAAVTQTEWDLYFPMLFPQPGDDPATVKQKKASRAATANALRASSGAAFDKMFPQYGAPQPTNTPDDPLGIR